MHTARARALGKLRQFRETAMSVGTADVAFGHAAPANDPPWMAYYDAANMPATPGTFMWSHPSTDVRH